MTVNKQPSVDDEMLSRYIEDDLEEDERFEVEALLDQNEDLRNELDLLRKTVNLMGSLPEIEAPESFAPNIRQRVRRLRIKRRTEAHNTGFRTGTYAMLVGIFLSILITLYLMVQFTLFQTPPPKNQKSPTTKTQKNSPKKTNTTPRKVTPKR